ncbi:S-layer homology domain-containing protein [Paenibacillus pectinilyticus]|uniref:S-layer homology domain-containing protein n=1 Tax=Paenibacillus pectinilyticus TaxID=512399 RepID=UPI0014289B45|nr:S-layer homology domain-containing protein [Paenibacillus pectinilyticus]
MKRKTILVTLICNLYGSFVLIAPTYAEDASKFAMTTSDTESVSGEFTITLKGQNIQDLYAYEAKLSFDTSKLEVVKADTKIAGFSVSPIVKDNVVTFAHTKVGNVDGEKGDLDIGTITFKAKKVGSSNIKWTSMKIVDHVLKNQAYTLDDSTVFTKIFSDLAGHWAKSDIMMMVDKNIVEGMDDDHFEPDTNVTRAQFATLLSKALNLKETTVKNPFTDVATGSWYENAVKNAYAAGIIDGISNNEFAPEKNITREEMTAMLIRAKSQATGTKVEDMTVNTSIHFNDEDAVSVWAQKVVNLAVGSGLMNGRTDQIFAPQEHANRAEAVVVLKRLLAGLGTI